jgi:ubiquitin carboxyl-terminal hydrolase 10
MNQVLITHITILGCPITITTIIIFCKKNGPQKLKKVASTQDPRGTAMMDAKAFVPLDPDDPFIVNLRRKYKIQGPTVPWYTCLPHEYPLRKRRFRHATRISAAAAPPPLMPTPAMPVWSEIATRATISAKSSTQTPQNGTTQPITTQTMHPAPSIKTRQSLGQVISEYDFHQRQQAELAKGLVNQGNICFMNCILQALTHCEHFYSLIMTLASQVQHKINSDTPILDGLVEFITEFSSQTSGPYTADSFYNVICKHKRFRHLQRGRQEDAQEFLGYLLECLEEEFLQAATASTVEITDDDASSDDTWVEVGKKNRPLQSRYAGRGVANSPVGKLFGGQFKSVLSMPNQPRTAPSVTYDPFQHVQLDISDGNVTSIEEAIAAMCEPETILYTTTQKGQVKATKQVQFHLLPRVLIVHLKRFMYSLDGWGSEDVKKITKPISFSGSLTIPNHPNAHYTLFAVVYHHGPSATVGHYTVDVKSRTGWTSIDDISLEQIAQAGSPTPGTSTPSSKTAYLLFYALEDG